jgi:hypothetical protein
MPATILINLNFPRFLEAVGVHIPSKLSQSFLLGDDVTRVITRASLGILCAYKVWEVGANI